MVQSNHARYSSIPSFFNAVRTTAIKTIVEDAIPKRRHPTTLLFQFGPLIAILILF